jgi:hypothetical protein
MRKIPSSKAIKVGQSVHLTALITITRTAPFPEPDEPEAQTRTPFY